MKKPQQPTYNDQFSSPRTSTQSIPTKPT